MLRTLTTHIVPACPSITPCGLIVPPPTIRIPMGLPYLLHLPLPPLPCATGCLVLAWVFQKHRSSTVLKMSACLSCSFGLFGLSGLFGGMRLTRGTRQGKRIASANP